MFVRIYVWGGIGSFTGQMIGWITYISICCATFLAGYGLVLYKRSVYTVSFFSSSLLGKISSTLGGCVDAKGGGGELREGKEW